jgi:hypothetical protein
MTPLTRAQVAAFLHEYLRGRAGVEGQPYALSARFMESAITQGVRTIFGVHLDRIGQPIRDAEEPEPGYFALRKLELLRDSGTDSGPRGR